MRLGEGQLMILTSDLSGYGAQWNGSLSAKYSDGHLYSLHAYDTLP